MLVWSDEILRIIGNFKIRSDPDLLYVIAKLNYILRVLKITNHVFVYASIARAISCWIQNEYFETQSVRRYTHHAAKLATTENTKSFVKR